MGFAVVVLARAFWVLRSSPSGREPGVNEPVGWFVSREMLNAVPVPTMRAVYPAFSMMQ
jgi:hypothetical protein